MPTDFLTLEKLSFSKIDMSDSFFDSLRADYTGFNNWFLKKSQQQETAFIHQNLGKIDGFLYLKDEDEAHVDIVPHFVKKRRLKIGTFKIDAHGTKLGEYFIRKILMLALEGEFEEVYITIYPKHQALVTLLKKYGFEDIGKKGSELVLLKSFTAQYNNIYKDFPRIKKTSNIYILPIYPEFHTPLFSSSKLKTESEYLVQDISHTNSIHKAYICGMSDARFVNPGDVLVIYRTAEQDRSAEYSAVVTSICVVEKYINISSYTSEASFIADLEPYSVFAIDQLKNFFQTKKYPHILKMMYNIPLKKRIIRKNLIAMGVISRDVRPNFVKLTDSQLNAILSYGGINASSIIY